MDYGLPATAAAAESAARAARTDVELVKHDINRLLLITEALWTILKAEHGYTDEVLTKKIAELDLQDGKLDGRGFKDQPQECPSCGRLNAAKRPFCIYCGKPIESKPFAR